MNKAQENIIKVASTVGSGVILFSIGSVYILFMISNKKIGKHDCENLSSIYKLSLSLKKFISESLSGVVQNYGINTYELIAIITIFVASLVYLVQSQCKPLYYHKYRRTGNRTLMGISCLDSAKLNEIKIRYNPKNIEFLILGNDIAGINMSYYSKYEKSTYNSKHIHPCTDLGSCMHKSIEIGVDDSIQSVEIYATSKVNYVRIATRANKSIEFGAKEGKQYLYISTSDEIIRSFDSSVCQTYMEYLNPIYTHSFYEPEPINNQVQNDVKQPAQPKSEKHYLG